MILMSYSYIGSKTKEMNSLAILWNSLTLIRGRSPQKRKMSLRIIMKIMQFVYHSIVMQKKRKKMKITHLGAEDDYNASNRSFYLQVLQFLRLQSRKKILERMWMASRNSTSKRKWQRVYTEQPGDVQVAMMEMAITFGKKKRTKMNN